MAAAGAPLRGSRRALSASTTPRARENLCLSTHINLAPEMRSDKTSEETAKPPPHDPCSTDAPLDGSLPHDPSSRDSTGRRGRTDGIGRTPLPISTITGSAPVHLWPHQQPAFTEETAAERRIEPNRARSAVQSLVFKKRAMRAQASCTRGGSSIKAKRR